MKIAKILWAFFGVIVVIIVISVIAGGGGDDEAKGDLNGTQAERAEALGLPVDCLKNKTCVVTKDIGEDLVGLDIDRELLDHQRETWASLAQINGLIKAKVVLEGDTTDIAGNAGNSSILSVLCDGKQVRRINWEEVTADGVKRLCDWQEEVNIE